MKSLLDVIRESILDDECSGSLSAATSTVYVAQEVFKFFKESNFISAGTSTSGNVNIYELKPDSTEWLALEVKFINLFKSLSKSHKKELAPRYQKEGYSNGAGRNEYRYIYFDNLLTSDNKPSYIEITANCTKAKVIRSAEIKVPTEYAGFLDASVAATEVPTDTGLSIEEILTKVIDVLKSEVPGQHFVVCEQNDRFSHVTIKLDAASAIGAGEHRLQGGFPNVVSLFSTVAKKLKKIDKDCTLKASRATRRDSSSATFDIAVPVKGNTDDPVHVSLMVSGYKGSFSYALCYINYRHGASFTSEEDREKIITYIKQNNLLPVYSHHYRGNDSIYEKI